MMKKQQPSHQSQNEYRLPADNEEEEEQDMHEEPYNQQQNQNNNDDDDDYGQQQIDEDQDEDDGDEIVDQVADTIPMGASNNANSLNNGINPYQHQQHNNGNVYHHLGGVSHNNQNNFGNVQMNPNFQFPGAQQHQQQQQQMANQSNSQNRLSNMPLGGANMGGIQGVGGRMRPQSAKVNDNQQLKFQQQQQQQMQMYGGGMMGNQPQWVGGNGALIGNYMSADPAIVYQLQQQQQQNMNPNAGGMGFIQNGYYGGIPQSSANLKKRPTTANRKNGNNSGLPLAFGGQKKSFPSKNPSTLDLEVSKLRPKIINQERERLYDDAMKQKMAANYLKDENVRLKTRIHKLEVELSQKEKLVDDLLQQQDSFQQDLGRPPKSSKIKLEGHLSQNLKRKIKELQVLLGQKHEENEVLKRNIKSTKTAEMEVEVKMFSDECVRLRHQLEEVIKSKDTFADPEELKIIESKFAQQDQIINQLRVENSELAQAYSKKEDENRQLREMFADMEKKTKKAISNAKEQAKLRKAIKTQEKDLKKLQTELASQKQLNDDYRNKIEEMVRKGPLLNNSSSNNNNNNLQNQSYNSYQQNTFNNNNKSGQLPNGGSLALSVNDPKVRQELQEKDQKIQELNNVVSQLQQKLQEKLNDLSRETAEKDKFKKLYEQYQDEVANLEGQLEDAGLDVVKKPPVKQLNTAANRPKSAYRGGAAANPNNQSIDNKLNQSKSQTANNKSKQQQEDDDYSDDNANHNQKSASIARAAEPKQPVGKTSQSIDIKHAKDITLELKLKLQSKGFFYHQINEFFFKPYQKDSVVSCRQLIDLFETNGFSEKRARQLARYIVEPKEQEKVFESDDNTCTQLDVVKTLSQLVGPYKLFNDANQVKKHQETLMKLFAKCKGTLKDTLQLEDYEDDGTVPLSAFKETFDTLDVKIADHKDVYDYMIYAMYQKSESLEKMNYQVLLDLVDGKYMQGGLSVGSSGNNPDGTGARKRPESSSPEKLKARNKEKYTGNQQSQPTDVSKKGLALKKIKGNDDDDDNEDDDDNYEEEFDKLLDKDDEDGGAPDDDSKKAKGAVGKKLNQKTEDDDEDGYGDDDPDFQRQPNAEGDEDGEGDDYIDEDQMLDVAEKCFMKIAEAIIQAGVSVRKAFANFIIQERLENDDPDSEDAGDQIIELLSPMGFLEGIKDLGVIDLEEVEVACLMRVLTKADLENAILLKELIVIMENFGIQDDEGEQSIQMLMGNKKQDDGVADQYGSQDIDQNDDMEPGGVSQSDIGADHPTDGKKKKKKGGSKNTKPLDLSALDEKSVKIMAKLMLALMELNVSLYEFFQGAIYEQLVKSKKKQNNVEIINTKDFYGLLQKRGVRKSDKNHENLTKFLQLDSSYPHMLMMKKIAKTLDAMSQNEELMAGIVAAAEDDMDMEGGMDYGDMDDDNNYQDDEDDGTGAPQNQVRLNTIGEEHDDYNTGTANGNRGAAAQAKQNKLAQQQQQQDEDEEENYDEDGYDENQGNDDYEF